MQPKCFELWPITVWPMEWVQSTGMSVYPFLGRVIEQYVRLYLAGHPLQGIGLPAQNAPKVSLKTDKLFGSKKSCP